jgi:hypothetical protein
LSSGSRWSIMSYRSVRATLAAGGERDT